MMAEKFYTRTLAGLYAEQGYLEDAEKAFQALLDQDPENIDLARELEKIRMMRQTSSGGNDLKSLVNEWVFLIRKAKSVQSIQ